jgi:hypothetical protein
MKTNTCLLTQPPSSSVSQLGGVEHVVAGERHHRKAAPPSGERVLYTGGFLLRLKQVVAGTLPLLGGDDPR